MNLFLTVAVASLGSYLFYKLKIPAGALIGAIIFSAVFNITTDLGEFPTAMKTVVQAIAGGFIGQRVTRRDVQELRQTFQAGLLMFFCMIVYTVMLGTFLVSTTSLDLATAMVCAMPAGLSDTAIVSADLGADSTQATVVHLVRTLFAILILPQVAFQVCKHLEEGSVKETVPVSDSHRVGYKAKEIQTNKNFVITIFLAQISGLLGVLSGIPAGAMTFAIIVVAGQNIKTGKAYLPKWLKLIAQCITGILVGLKVSMDDVLNMNLLIQPILAVLICTVLCNYICAFLMHKVCKLDISTSLFGSIPAGVSDMALIATDMGGDAPKVSVLQLVRYIGMFTVMPLIIQFLIGLESL